MNIISVIIGASNISRKQGCKIIAARTRIEEEHGSMMVILPNGLIHAHDLNNGLIGRKRLGEIV